MRSWAILLATILTVSANVLAVSEFVRRPQLLAGLFEAYDRDTKAGQNIDPMRLSEIDFAAGQKDAVYSRLYWYTNMEEAKAEAAAQKKPILSLRMLGKLDEEMSCANSRFFRTILYANTSVSKIMREEYVLHWQSVRDVPVMTIRYADGRKIERPITGNSMHMVLRADGSVVDVLPGMVSPEAFINSWMPT